VEKGVSEAKEEAKDCLTPASPFGFAGGSEESMGRKPEKIASRSGEDADQAAFASRCAGDNETLPFFLTNVPFAALRCFAPKSKGFAKHL